MKNLHYGENINSYNENSCQELAWAIEASFGEFSLILVRCNYANLREHTVQQLREMCAFKIREVHLSESEKTLHSTIKNNLGDEHPLAVMVFGLESVITIEQLLTTTNSVREEFRKNFSFPLVLWINDDILQKLICLAPDFETWSTTIEFIITDNELIHLIQQTADDVFAKLLDFGAGLFLDNAALKLGVGSPRRVELESAWRELIERKIAFSPELKASLEFVMGRDSWSSAEMSRQYYENSLAYWRETHNLERQGCLLYCLGLWWRRYAEENHGEYKLAILKSKSYFEECIGVFEQTEKPQLVAQFINALGATLDKLEQWEELEVIAQKALVLHQVYYKPFRLARAYGFLAEVALAKSVWMEAKQLAEKALSTMRIGFVVAENQDELVRNISLDWVRSYHQGWYLLALGRSLFSLNQIPEAIKVLETAKLETKPNYDPSLYLRILEELRQSYFQEGQYLTAFQVKQQQRSIEQQYSLRAFIGAGRLQPKQRVVNPSLPPVEKPREVAQEIAASGRQQDVDRLVERMRRHDCKLTVIHGQSGVGKSSIIKAGFIPALQQKLINSRTVLPVCQRVYTDWIKELGQRLAKALRNMGNADFSDRVFDSTEAIIQELGVNCDRNLLTVLIFDQFEEFFFVCKEPNQRHEFYEFLRNCLDIPYLKVVLSLREDYLHYLLEFNRLTNLEVISNNILDKNILYYLGNFSVADTKRIIQDLTRQTQFYLEPKLVDKLVIDLSQELDEVRPIELQVVGTQLQSLKISTLEQYQQHGSKQQLVEQFLEEVVRDCGSENEQVAQLVFYLLTDENNTRPLKTRTELESNLNGEAHKLDLVLKILVGAGLVFRVPELPVDRYQLVHDYLVPFIRQQRGAELLAELEREREQRKLSEQKLSRVLKQRLQVAITAGFGLAILAALAIGFAVDANSQKKLAQIGQIEALSASSKALFVSDKKLDSLLAAVTAGLKLREFRLYNIYNPNPSQTKIIQQVYNTLQQAVYGVQEHNRIERSTEPIYSVVFSPDGKTIATANGDKTIKLFRIDGSLLRVFSDHKGELLTVAFSPDGKLLASGSRDKIVNIWRVKDGSLLKSIQAHAAEVVNVNFSLDSQILASASIDGTVKLWNVNNGKLIKTLQSHNGEVRAVKFSPNGKFIVSVGWDKPPWQGKIRIWNVEGVLLRTVDGRGQGTDSADFALNSQTVVTANGGGNLRIWKIAEIHTFKLDKSVPRSINFSPNGQNIVIASDSGKVQFIQITNGQLLTEIKAHDNWSMGAVFSPSGQIIASISIDRTVKLWTVDGRLIKVLNGHNDAIYGVAFSPDGKTLATVSADKTVRLWNVEGAFLKTLDGNQENAHSSVSFSPDGKIIASASWDEIEKKWNVKLWNTNGKLLRSLGGHKYEVGKGDIKTTTFSQNSQLIASASWDGTVKVWTVEGKLLTDFKEHGKPVKGMTSNPGIRRSVNSVSFHPNGKFLASVGYDRNIRLWKLDGTPLKVIPNVHTDQIYRIKFSPDGKTFATASWDRTVKLWSIDGKLLRIFSGHSNWIHGLAFSPDGKLLASAGLDRTVKLWDINNGKLLQTFVGHEDGIYDLSFSPNGKIIASASSDKTIRLWSLDGTLLKTITGHIHAVYGISFSPDGKTIASASWDGSIKIWSAEILDFDRLLVRGCALIRDYLKTNPNVKDSEARLLCNAINIKK